MHSMSEERRNHPQVCNIVYKQIIMYCKLKFFYEMITAIGPCRTELERMKQFKNNQDDEFSGFVSPSNPPLLGGNKGKKSPELEPYSRPKSPKQATGNPRYERIETSLGLGELDGLTIMNEAGLGGIEVSNNCAR